MEAGSSLLQVTAKQKRIRREKSSLFLKRASSSYDTRGRGGEYTHTMKILVFGNPLVKKDRLPLMLMAKLQKEFPQIEFREFDAVEDLHKEGRVLYILDSVEGIENVEVITDIDMLLVNRIYSVHDFDLAYALKLMKKMNMVEKVTIFGVPTKMRRDVAIRQLRHKIGSILS